MKPQPGDVLVYQPKKYFSKARTLKWGFDLTPKQMKALRAGEVFTLLDANGKRYKMILMDSYNTIREKAI